MAASFGLNQVFSLEGFRTRQKHYSVKTLSTQIYQNSTSTQIFPRHKTRPIIWSSLLRFFSTFIVTINSGQNGVNETFKVTFRNREQYSICPSPTTTFHGTFPVMSCSPALPRAELLLSLIHPSSVPFPSAAQPQCKVTIWCSACCHCDFLCADTSESHSDRGWLSVAQLKTGGESLKLLLLLQWKIKCHGMA